MQLVQLGRSFEPDTVKLKTVELAVLSLEPQNLLKNLELHGRASLEDATGESYPTYIQ